jgi:hypothetical protein
MTLDECIHGLGPVEACTICNGRDKREAAANAERPRTFPAKYTSHCRGCNLPIAVGQVVAWLPDHAATHEECWP